jgi:hypothetical protein
MKRRSRQPSEAQLFHRERGFLMKGRIAALSSNLNQMYKSPFITNIEKEIIIEMYSRAELLLRYFDDNTVVLKARSSH